MIRVSATDPTTYRSIQEAIDLIPDLPSDTQINLDSDAMDERTIFIESGIYNEKLFIRKDYIRLIGDSSESTVITYNDYGRKLIDKDSTQEYGTFNSATALLTGTHLYIQNLTFINSSGPGKIAGQALAVFVAADKIQFHHCQFKGFQDTLYTGDLSDGMLAKLIAPSNFLESSVTIPAHQKENFFNDCYIEGDVDYIFGNSLAYFYRCHIHTLRLESESDAFITAANTPADADHGLIFFECKITGSGIRTTNLGRPWRNYAKTAFIHCYMDESITPHGWTDWGKPAAQTLCQYLELNNIGPGADASHRASFAKILSTPDLTDYYQYASVFDDFDIILS